VHLGLLAPRARQLTGCDADEHDRQSPTSCGDGERPSALRAGWNSPLRFNTNAVI